MTMLEDYVIEMCSYGEYHSRKEYDNKITSLRKKYKMIPKNTDIIKTYNHLISHMDLKHVFVSQSKYQKFHLELIVDFFLSYETHIQID